MYRDPSASTGPANQDQNAHPPRRQVECDRSDCDPTENVLSEPTDFVEYQTSPNKTAVRLPKIIPFETLSRCGGEVWIENGGQIYRLRKTKQGKLILTK